MIKHRNIYSFGPMPDALETMYGLRDNPDRFPKILKEKQYNLEDLQEWILTLETGITSTGRPFDL